MSMRLLSFWTAQAVFSQSERNKEPKLFQGFALFSGELLVSTLTRRKRHKTSAPFAFAGAVGGPAEDLALMHAQHLPNNTPKQKKTKQKNHSLLCKFIYIQLGALCLALVAFLPHRKSLCVLAVRTRGREMR